MESLEHAMKRDAPILAEYLGGAVNSDAYHIKSPRPDGLCLSLCIQSSLVDAGVSVEEVFPLFLIYISFKDLEFIKIHRSSCLVI